MARSLAAVAIRRAKGDTNHAIGEVYAHKNRVAKGWIKEDEAVQRTISEAQGKSVLWIDLIGGDNIQCAPPTQNAT